MTHYEVLGVASDASHDEIHRAYLDAARRVHPDVAGPGGERSMRALNAARRVLEDDVARARYDMDLALRSGNPASSTSSSSSASTDRPASGADDINRPGDINRPPVRAFVPVHASDEDDDDSWRYTDDVTDPDTAAGPVLQFLPLVLLATGVGAVVIGGVIGVQVVLACGFALITLAVVGFLAAPLIAMNRAQAVEFRRERGDR